MKSKLHGIFNYIFYKYVLYSYAYARLFILSEINRARAFFKKTSIKKYTEYETKPILALAIYEKNIIRQDVVNLLKIAKQLGFYVLLVNSQKLTNPGLYSGLIDVYIERYNFGRDFGSYKTALQYLYKNKIASICPRLVILNDSVFFSLKNLEEFLTQLRDAELEVVAATENHEINHHLGSFCLSMDGGIVNHEKFIRFWKNYRLSDLRPVVIKNGELALTETLRSCVSEPSQIRALYDLRWLIERLEKSSELLTANNIFSISRTSSYPLNWKNPSMQDMIFSALVKRRIDFEEKHDNSVLIDLDENADIFFQDYVDNGRLCAKLIYARDVLFTSEELDQLARRQLLECFGCGSQIHHNAILLYFLGLPIIKIDGFYRGFWLVSDVEKIVQMMPQSEQENFRQLVYARFYGMKVLAGWRLAAFKYSLL